MKNEITTIREKLNMTQSELAATIGVSQPSVCCYENDINEPSYIVARRIVELAKENGVYSDIDRIKKFN